MKTVKVKYLQSHPKDAYFAGDIAEVSADKAAARHKTGHVIILPDDEEEPKVNTLPGDLPGREKLFELGFTTLEEIKAAGDTLLDEGISKAMLGKIMKFVE